jgi:hypothetical protein
MFVSHFCFDITDPDKNFHYVVDCGHNIMKEHCYWPLVSDLNNVLSHRPVAVKFMSDDNLLEMWFAFLSMFQGEDTMLRRVAWPESEERWRSFIICIPHQTLLM